MNIKIENILTLENKDGKHIINNRDIYIADGKIVSIDNEPQGFCPERIINRKNTLAIPGLINTHTHSYMSVFRNIADDLNFSDWLFGRINPLEDKLTHEDMYWGALLGCIEMMRTGTTCFVDMNMDMNAVIEAVDKIGMRAVLSRGLVGNGSDMGGQKRLNENLDAYKNCKSDKISILLGPHAPYTCDKEYLKIVADAAKENSLGITIHLSETQKEVSETVSKYRLTPIELMAETGIFDVQTIAAHCIYVSDADISILKEKGVSVATNPKSNLKLANGIAPIYKMHENGVNITVGTDSAASNNTLNMFSEMNYAALLQKGISKNPVVISADDVLPFVTENAAKAVGNTKLGKIAEGMSADITIIDIDAPQFYPRNNLASALVYSANGSEVDTVIVGGEIIMENKQITTVDCDRVYFECEKIIERIDR